MSSKPRLSFIAALLGAAVALPAAAQSQPLATGDVNAPGVVAEVTECKISEGALSLRIRLRNTGTEGVSLWPVKQRKYDEHYVVAGKKKYLMMRDAAKKPIAPGSDAGGNVYVSLKKSGVYNWWAKFPAPPEDVTKVEYHWPIGSPISDIPCTRS